MRRRRVVKRELTPDVKYNSLLVARLINTIMTRGKKSTAQGIVYSAFELMEAKKPERDALNGAGLDEDEYDDEGGLKVEESGSGGTIELDDKKDKDKDKDKKEGEKEKEKKKLMAHSS